MDYSNPREFWERRLTESYSLEGVGWAGMGVPFNTWMYRVRRHVFLRTLAPFVTRPAEMRALDVGSGTGFYVERWHELGVGSVAGTDITTAAVEQLAARHPGDEFVRLDIGDRELPLEPGSFDLVSAMDVLFHIVDDERYARGLRNVRSLLAAGGVFAFSDNFLHRGERRGDEQSSRPLAEIERLVRDAGLEVLARVPMFVLLNTPLDSSSRFLHGSWRVLQTLAGLRPELGGAAAAAVYPVELALLRVVREGPSTELMICRRPAGR